MQSSCENNLRENGGQDNQTRIKGRNINRVGLTIAKCAAARRGMVWCRCCVLCRRCGFCRRSWWRCCPPGGLKGRNVSMSAWARKLFDEVPGRELNGRLPKTSSPDLRIRSGFRDDAGGSATGRRRIARSGRPRKFSPVGAEASGHSRRVRQKIEANHSPEARMSFSPTGSTCAFKTLRTGGDCRAIDIYLKTNVKKQKVAARLGPATIVRGGGTGGSGRRSAARLAVYVSRSSGPSRKKSSFAPRKKEHFKEEKDVSFRGAKKRKTRLCGRPFLAKTSIKKILVRREGTSFGSAMRARPRMGRNTNRGHSQAESRRVTAPPQVIRADPLAFLRL